MLNNSPEFASRGSYPVSWRARKAFIPTPHLFRSHWSPKTLVVVAEIGNETTDK